MLHALFSLAALAIDIWIVYLIVTSRASAPKKVLWILLVLFLPLLGPVLWFVLGPKD